MQTDQIVLGGLETLVVEQGEPSSERPLLIALHGRGASAEDLMSLLPEVMPGTVLGLFPNAPLAMYLGAWGIGYAWYELGAEQSATLQESRDRLTKFLDAVVAKFGVPPERTLLAGFSQGAVMTLEVGLRYPARLAGLIALSGYLPEAEKTLQEATADRDRPILIAHGRADDIVPIAAGRMVSRELRELGYPVEYREFPIGHSINADELVFIRDWIKTRLP